MDKDGRDKYIERERYRCRERWIYNDIKIHGDM